MIRTTVIRADYSVLVVIPVPECAAVINEGTADNRCRPPAKAPLLANRTQASGNCDAVSIAKGSSGSQPLSRRGDERALRPIVTHRKPQGSRGSYEKPSGTSAAVCVGDGWFGYAWQWVVRVPPAISAGRETLGLG